MTPEKIQEVKDRFFREGVTFADWARERGYRPNDVYRVLNGQFKCTRGKGHDIARDLGLK